MAIQLPNQFIRTRLPPPQLSLSPSKAPPYSARPIRPQWSCRKKEIHPEFYNDAKVYCNNELVMTTGGTEKEYVVDVWSGNHPFYLGNRSGVTVNADQVEKFRKKYGDEAWIMQIPVLKGELIIPPKRKASGKGGKKK